MINKSTIRSLEKVLKNKPDQYEKLSDKELDERIEALENKQYSNMTDEEFEAFILRARNNRSATMSNKKSYGS